MAVEGFALCIINVIIRWDLAIAAAAGWALVYLCTFRRLSLFRKVIFPIFALSSTVLLALVLRSATADGGTFGLWSLDHERFRENGGLKESHTKPIGLPKSADEPLLI